MIYWCVTTHIFSLQTSAQTQEADEPIVGTLEKYHNPRGGVTCDDRKTRATRDCDRRKPCRLQSRRSGNGDELGRIGRVDGPRA